MQQDNTRNTIIFVVCMAVILIGYQAFILQPQQKARQAQLAQQQAAAAKTAPAPAALPTKVFASRQQAIAASARIPIRTKSLQGSLSLTGARIDDLKLVQFRQTLDKNSPMVELFTPDGAKNAYFATFSWKTPGPTGQLTDALSPDAVWRPVSTGALTETHPVVLAFDTVEGLHFERTIAVDDKAMFTITDRVTNTSGAPRVLRPVASVERHGLPDEATHRAVNVHQGAVATFVGPKAITQQISYKDWAKRSEKPAERAKLTHQTTGGWFGITDKYWLAAIVPNQKQAGEASLNYSFVNQTPWYQAAFAGPLTTVPAGAQTTETTRLFAGAKQNDVLEGYSKTLGIPRFRYAIDWGRLFFLTQPIFWLIDTFWKLVGNFGVAIMMLTVVVRALFFPLANQTFASGAKMKKLQPKIEELKKRFKDDPAKLQEAQMKLFQTEKINPLAGCLPILVQIPVFLALFKVLSVTIEMRHAEFFWFIQDLSARDPSTIWNLFGLIPWNPATAPVIGGLLDGTLHIGVMALAYAGAMSLQQAMTPMTAGDPTQQAIMKFFPIVFMFILANYPVGLLIYWTWSTVLSLIQQYWFMKKYGTENPIDSFLQKIGLEKKAPVG